jgi:hypothetical protein
VISLNLVLAGLRLGLKNRQVNRIDIFERIIAHINIQIQTISRLCCIRASAKSTVVGQTTAVVSYGGAP